MNLWGPMLFFCDCLLIFVASLHIIVIYLYKTFDSNFTQRPLTGRSVFLVFFSKSLASGISGVYSPTAKKKDMRKEAKAYNMFFFWGGRRVKKVDSDLPSSHDE